MIIIRTIFVILISTSCLQASKIQIPIQKIAELHIPISHKHSERVSHSPLISGDSFRAIADWIVDETTPSFDTTHIKKGDIVFVGFPFLNFFFNQIFPHIKCPIILISSNGSGTIDSSYRVWLDQPNLIAWYSRNIIIKHPKAICIPVGICWFMNAESYNLISDRIKNFKSDNYFQKKKIPIYFNLSLGTHFSRKLLYNVLKNKPKILMTSYKSYNLYLDEMENSEFVISCRGFNIDCYRTIEALLMGSIPVIEKLGIEEVYKDLPVIIVNDLKTVTYDSLCKERDKLKHKRFRFEKLSFAYWEGLIKAEKEKHKINS